MNSQLVGWACGLILVIGAENAAADIIPPDSHRVSRCVKIVNPHAIEGIRLIGAISGPTVDGIELHRIDPGVCLRKGYKFNDFAVYWVDAQALIHPSPAANADGTIADPSYHLITANLETWGGYEPNSNPLVSETLFYELRLVDEQPTLKLTRRETVEIFE